MSPCSYCADTGWSSIGMMCRCEKGAELRKQANLDAIRANVTADPSPAPTSASLHAQWMLGPAEVGPIASGPFPDDDLTHPTMAERLRAIGYREPVLPKPAHVCVSGCGSAVSACGTQCLRCHEETVAIERRQAAKEAHWLYAVLFGLVAACPLYFVIFKLLRWMP